MNGKAIDQVKDALLALSDQCNYAQTLDGVGFSKFDAEFGNKLAQQRYPLTEKQALAALRLLRKYHRQLDSLGIELPDVEDVKKEVANREVVEKKGPAGSLRAKDGDIVVSFRYDAALVEKCRMIRAVNGGKYDAATRNWIFPKKSIDLVLSQFEDKFELDESIFELVNEYRAEVERQHKIEHEKEHRSKVYLEKAQEIIHEEINGITLMQHQKEGVEYALARHRMVLADEMGLGKTLTALFAAKVIKEVTGASIFVVARPSLHDKAWRKDAEIADVPIEIFSTHVNKIPKPLKNEKYVVIADEAHDFQNIKSGRTKKLLELTDHPNCIAAFMLTGTPIKNGRPANLFPLLVATKHRLAENKARFEKRYCNAGPTRFSKWDVSGAAHLDELHEETKDVILRRLKKDCVDLPPKTRILRKAELTPEAEKLYSDKIAEFAREYMARLLAGEIKSGGEVLVGMTHARHAGSIAKVDTAVELTEELVEEGRQVVIFTEFAASVEAIVEKLEEKGIRTAQLTGQTPQPERKLIVDAFQEGRAEVFVGTVRAGGVGLTLTAADTVIMVDRPWTPGDAVQAEDRCHRIGQNSNVTAVWIQCGEMDEKIDEVLIEKQKRIDLVMEGKRKTMRGLGSVAQIANEFIAKVSGETLRMSVTED